MRGSNNDVRSDENRQSVAVHLLIPEINGLLAQLVFAVAGAIDPCAARELHLLAVALVLHLAVHTLARLVLLQVVTPPMRPSTA